MKRFARLFNELDSTTSTNLKVDAMGRYFSEVNSADAAWALFILTGQKLKRLIPTKELWTWTMQETGVSEWLLTESYSSVGDTAECCALLLGSLRPSGVNAAVKAEELCLHEWMRDRLLPLREMEYEEQRASVIHWWSELSEFQVFILNKLLTGSLRVGVSQTLVVRALAKVSEAKGINLTTAEMAHRLMGEWQPTPERFEGLFEQGSNLQVESQPYPFFLASPLEKDPKETGEPHEWQAEWKWDGIRAQLIRRGPDVYIWSRGEELITERFPELVQAALTLPEGVVLDGEVLAYKDGKVKPFVLLQKRIGRKKPGKKVLEEAPAIFMIYDLLEYKHQDLRELPMNERRNQLEHLIETKSKTFQVSPIIEFESWEDLADKRTESRSREVEGIMLKRKSSPYQSGRRRGDWWKWKIDPYTVDAVLIYAQSGSGRRANLFTDYTFAVWKESELVPIAKAYSGLTDEEIGKLDHWIRRHTKDKFGPVRSVDPEHVFELAFEGIAESPRHKAGIALRFPRILKWRSDKKPKDADTIETLRELLHEASH